MLAASSTLAGETTAEKMKGTLRWLAFEFFEPKKGQTEHTKESDVWAFGMTAYVSGHYDVLDLLLDLREEYRSC